MIRGIDVSHHNPNPDFAKAKEAGIAFVYVKATEGKTYRDPQYQSHALNALKAGLHVGFYHFARPDNNKPEDEVKNFVDAISSFKYDLLPVLDLEVSVAMSDNALYEWVKSFIDGVKAKTGHNVMLYTGLHYLNNKPALKKLASDGVPLWIAAYRPVAPEVNGWDWVIWQYNDQEQIPGIGHCDANNLVDLTKILINPPAKKPTKPKLTLPNVVLKLGDRGEAVKQVQTALNKLKFNCGSADGIYGSRTKDAVLSFQKAYGIKPFDGIYGPKTRAKMLELL